MSNERAPGAAPGALRAAVDEAAALREGTVPPPRLGGGEARPRKIGRMAPGRPPVVTPAVTGVAPAEPGDVAASAKTDKPGGLSGSFAALALAQKRLVRERRATAGAGGAAPAAPGATAALSEFNRQALLQQISLSLRAVGAYYGVTAEEEQEERERLAHLDAPALQAACAAYASCAEVVQIMQDVARAKRAALAADPELAARYAQAAAAAGP